jgi:tetratricopeptide (TPR) repeat protein
MLIVSVALLGGCHGDPNVRKQKYFESGKRYSAEGKYREAAIQYSNALKIDKTYADAHYELGRTFEHLGQFNAAYSEFARTVDLQPTNYKARTDLGNLALAGGRIDDAQTQAKAVLAAQPNNPDVHALLSAIARKRGLNDQALTEMNRALELDPNRAAFHEDLALLESIDPAKTSAEEAEMKKAIALDPKSVNAKLLLSGFYARNKRWPEAEQESLDAIKTDSNSISARTSLAQIYLVHDEPAKAEGVLRQASLDLENSPQGVRLLADYYAATGQLDKAKVEFARISSKFYKNTSLQKAYIRVLLQVKDFQAAQTSIASLLKVSPKDPETAGLNGIVLLNSGKTSDAVIALQNAAKNYPKDAFIQYWLGKAAEAKGDAGLAESSFRESTKLNPGGVDAQQELARIAAQRGDMNLLADVAGKTIAATPRFAGGYVWRAIVEMSHNQLDKSEADLKTAISVAPRSPQPYLQLGKLNLFEKHFPEGVALLQQALDLDPNSIEAIRLLISYDLYQKQPAKALARLNAQIAKSPSNSGLYDLLAKLQMDSKNLDQASAAAEKAIQLNASDGDAVMLYAQIQVGRGQVPSAISAWEKWLSSHPADPRALALLGMLEESRGDLGKAEGYYKHALQVQPTQALAANNLAFRMLEDGENVDVALTLAQTARQGMPNSPDTADTLAWAYYHKGTFAFARDLLEDALKAEPNNATMQYHLGMVYGKMRDKSNAAIHLKKALSLAPDSPMAKDARTALQGLG